MPQYKYTAYDIRGKKYKGKKEFSTEAEFRKFLKSKRMILIKFEILKKNKKKKQHTDQTDIYSFLTSF